MEIGRHYFVSPISDLCHIILNTAPIKPFVFPGEFSAQTKDRLNNISDGLIILVVPTK